MISMDPRASSASTVICLGCKTDKEIAGTPHFRDYQFTLCCTRQFEEMSFVYKISDEVTPQKV
jgi:hypothetical protein